MRFTAQLQEIDFDFKGYQARLDQFFRETTEEAARSWLRTVLDIVPTWSRASRATFEALANEVGFNITYGPIRSDKDRLTLGLQTGRGGTNWTKTGYHFFYETDLRYLEYNEFNNAVPGPPPQPFGHLRNQTPYHFLEAGQKDFRSFVQQIDLPSPAAYIRGRRI